MKAWSLLLIELVLVFIGCVTPALATPLVRVPNNTLTNVPPSPPTFGFTSVNAFGSLTFTNPVAIVTPPGETNRIFILEKRGRIIVVTNLAAPTRTIFMDITARVIANDSVGGEEGLLGLAFHPGYPTNRYFYVYYTGNDNTTGTTTRHDILSRFTTSPVNPNAGQSGTEVKLIRQLDQAGNHNGGDLHFGPDGYLYLSLGDEGGGNDQYANSQLITKDFFSGILRLDVDNHPGNLAPNAHVAVTANYRVPVDNPFVHTNLGGTWDGTFNGSAIANLNSVRTEFWAVGLRNPWRMSFDPVAGTLYCGDVGQNAGSSFEEINLIIGGGNYGWAYRLGSSAGPKPGAPANFDVLYHQRPLFAYATSSTTGNRAIVGGVKYWGHRLSQLHGAYIYGDYSSGRIWALRHTGTTVTQNTQILQDAPLSCFGIEPPSGDVLYAHIGSGLNSTIKRINYNTTPAGPPLPSTLVDAGVFSDTTNLIPHAGIVPYDVNLPSWSDNAIMTRWFSIPNTNLTATFNRTGNWSFPAGTVWIKHFELELTNGVPASRKRIETQMLVKNASGGYGMTFRWGNSTSNATLVAESGMDEAFVVDDGGTLRTQIWHYPSRVECLQCHTTAGGFALGFNTAQLNRDFDYDGTVTNQIAALSHAGYFNTNVTGIHILPAMVRPANTAVSLEYRVRSYLAANCAQCHQSAGTAPGLWDARLITITPDAGLVNGSLVNDGGDANNRVFVPGSISNSMLLTRISSRGPGQMPPLATSLVDTQGVALLSAWITNDLPGWQNFQDFQIAYFGATNVVNGGSHEDFDGDGDVNYLEHLNSTSPTNAASFWSIAAQPNGHQVEIVFPQQANRGFEVQFTDEVESNPAWSPLDVPANAPLFSISNRTAAVADTATETNRIYRVRVFEP